MTKSCLWLLLPFLLSPLGCKRSTSGCTLRVAAASSLITALGPINTRYTNATKCRVSLDTGSSGVLRRKLERGAPHDVFLSASAFQMTQLKRRGLLTPGSIRTFGSNRLVLILPQARPQKLPNEQALRKWLQAPRRRTAIGDPAHVPAGRYAREALRALGLWQALQPRLVRTQHVRAAMQTVRQGHLSAAIVFASDAQVAKRYVVVAYTFSSRHHSPIRYQGAVRKRSPYQTQGRQYLAHLRSPASQATLQAHGFLPTQRPSP